MKKTIHSIAIISVFALFISSNLNAQVGIGTTSPNSDALLEIGDGTDTKGLILPRVSLSTGTISAAPLSSHITGMLIYNTNTVADVTPGIYINNGSSWARSEDLSPAASSVSLSGDIEISSSTYANVPGMGTLTFTARKTTVMVLMSASGFGYTNSMAYVQLRVRNNTTNTVLGGTNNNIQSYDEDTGTITTWSASFSKPLTGLTIGTTYTLQVQGQVGGILGTNNAAIFENTNPDSHHLTLSVFQ
tara:strand:- start:5955 stop:6692 length:738 start_codon:yes stop_codon:yes gene_type:complete